MRLSRFPGGVTTRVATQNAWNGVPFTKASLCNQKNPSLSGCVSHTAARQGDSTSTDSRALPVNFAAIAREGLQINALIGAIELVIPASKMLTMARASALRLCQLFAIVRQQHGEFRLLQLRRTRPVSKLCFHFFKSSQLLFKFPADFLALC